MAKLVCTSYVIIYRWKTHAGDWDWLWQTGEKGWGEFDSNVSELDWNYVCVCVCLTCVRELWCCAGREWDLCFGTRDLKEQPSGE